jgi:GT2 family glycosyltransferase
MTKEQEKRHSDAPPDRVVIVSLSKYSELFVGLDSNLKQFVSNEKVDKVVVRDGMMIESAPGWYMIDGPEDFNFSGNVNLGLKAVDENSDVLFISDDVRLTQENTVQRLMDLAYSDPSIGLLAPRVIGPADNPLQTDPPKDKDIVFSERYIVFVCLYIKRKVIQSVGYMDKETFNGYGWDDVDYSRRVKNAGLRLAIAPDVEVIHGVTRKGTETFFKSEKGLWDRLEKQNKHNAQVFFNKWGDNNKE